MAITLFTSRISGPPPGNATTGAEQWINLGTIPTGFKLWFGTGNYTSPDKAITFELRSNLSGQSSGAIEATSLLGSISANVKNPSVLADYYKKGRLHTISILGSGVECFWLRLKSKSGTQGSYLYSINYTQE